MTREPLNEQELAALASAVKLAPLGFVLAPERVEDRAVCDDLVERGSLVAVKGLKEGLGFGYRASDELIAAIGQRASVN